MGLDLRLLPFDQDGTQSFSQTVLSVNQCYDLFEKILSLPAYTVPEQFNSFYGDNSHYGITTHDAYGTRLTYVYAKDLRFLGEEKCIETDQKNRAIWAYISVLPDLTKIALYWK